MAPSKFRHKESNVSRRSKAQPSSHSQSKNSSDEFSSNPQTSPHLISLDLQQLLLSVFKNAFPASLSSPTSLKSVIQEVKGHLYNRDFAAAFGKEEYLEAYALRWSPVRALAYAGILRQDQFLKVLRRRRKEGLDEGASIQDAGPPKVVCVGGGAGAEIVALAGVVRHIESGAALEPRSAEEQSDEEPERSTFSVVAVDKADWSVVVDRLRHSILEPPPLTSYASEAAKITNKALLGHHRVTVRFSKGDILEFNEEDMRRTFYGASLVTLMFTLNELFSSSIAKTTTFLLRLAGVLDPGTLLLVADSPGSYSTVALGKDVQKSGSSEAKKYPMKWLLEHALLTTAEGQWERVTSEDSTWFRLSEKLKYPIDLEDMRYQIHLYRRLWEKR